MYLTDLEQERVMEAELVGKYYEFIIDERYLDSRRLVMSGSGGGGGTDSGTELNCETVSFTTTLASVQSDALEKVQVRDRLQVNVDNGKVIVVLPDSDELVGSINWAQNSKLVSCMEEGYEYIATVREIDDGMVKVHVTAA